MGKPKGEVKRDVFSTRIDPELIKRLKHLAVDKNTRLNYLLEESIRMLLKKYKR